LAHACPLRVFPRLDRFRFARRVSWDLFHTVGIGTLGWTIERQDVERSFNGLTTWRAFREVPHLDSSPTRL
jgi:hypothetical protein